MVNPSIRPEFHTCEGRMEAFINLACTALEYEESHEDIRARLCRHGAEPYEAFHAVVAAGLLSKREA